MFLKKGFLKQLILVCLYNNCGFKKKKNWEDFFLVIFIVGNCGFCIQFNLDRMMV